MTQTLDQKRAAFAWQAASLGMQRHGDDYKRLAKGAPALIMNSGLMPTLAFYASKKEAHEMLLNDVCAWFGRRFAGRKEYQPAPHHFAQVMAQLQGQSSAFYLEATDEALAILKWIRQFVDAVPQRENDHG
jgi:CRISPR-associated protein Cmr5